MYAMKKTYYDIYTETLALAIETIKSSQLMKLHFIDHHDTTGDDHGDDHQDQDVEK
jgi:hypothetical protein